MTKREMFLAKNAKEALLTTDGHGLKTTSAFTKATARHGTKLKAR
jgi:hypothetical protein